jgi:hypothetical protein
MSYPPALLLMVVLRRGGGLNLWCGVVCSSSFGCGVERGADPAARSAAGSALCLNKHLGLVTPYSTLPGDSFSSMLMPAWVSGLWTLSAGSWGFAMWRGVGAARRSL